VRAARIEVEATGDRRSLEALYLDLREIAKQHGLRIEIELGRDAPNRELST
jgi:hypothetical protein